MDSSHYLSPLRSRRVTEDDLRKMRSEHDAYEAMNARAINACRGASCRQGRLPCRERCGAEMGGDAGDAPTVPTRRLPTKPRLSAWRRLLLWLTSWRASWRRSA